MYAKKILLLPALALGILFLSHCSPKVAKTVTPAPATRAPTMEPKFTDAQIMQGQDVYRSNCGKCHKLFNPADHSLDKWNKVLPPMIAKAHLDAQQGALVRAYVMANLAK